MKIIGITGGIGSGKSRVLHLLQTEYQAYIVEADSLAHKLMQKEQPAYNWICETFGTDIVGTDGELDRTILGKIVFGNEKKLQQLNAIVHPAVKQYIKEDIAYHRKKEDVKYYIIEAALLIEDGYKDICDELWYIYADKEIRISRLLSGRGGTRQKWISVMENQADDDFYIQNCEHIVNNNDDFVKTANVVKELLFSSI